MAIAELAAGLEDSWDYFLHLAIVLVPLFLGASFLVGLVQEYVTAETVERRLRRHDDGAGNVVAAALGAVTPFCSCSTVPMLAGLLQAGAPLGMAVSFLLASPLVNEIAVIFLFGLFGLEVTAWYVLATFGAAVAGGIVVGRLGLEDHVKDVQIGAGGEPAVATDGGGLEGSSTVGGGSVGGCGTVDGGSVEGCGTVDGGTVDGCASRDSKPPGKHRRRLESAAREAWSFFLETLPYLLLGMTIGALVHGVVPRDLLHAVIGPENPLAVPIAALAGAPIYVSISGMVPIAASFSQQGIPIGTVLAFVVGGAGMSLPNLILLNKLFERRLLAVYAATVVLIATLVGVGFNAVLV